MSINHIPHMKNQLFTLLILLVFSSAYAQEPADDLSTSSIELPTASLEDAGFNSDSINILLDKISTTPHKDFRGIVVIKDGHIVIEEYYNTFWRNTILDIRSAGKSITALLLGVAMKEGLIKSLDESVYSLFSSNKELSINEAYKKITLRHLLDMSSGLDADTNDPETVGQAGNWIASDDWKAYLLNVPQESEPGKGWVYADIHAVLIGLAIEEASGMSLRDYAQQKLFDPLGIKQVYWYTNASNQTGAAGNLYITTLAFAKLGLLVANEGKWADTQIIDPDYIQELITHKGFELTEDFSPPVWYGMLWYKDTRILGDKRVDYLWASGNGGNHLVVVPELNMVVALTSSAYGPGYGQGRSYTILGKIFEALE